MPSPSSSATSVSSDGGPQPLLPRFLFGHSCYLFVLDIDPLLQELSFPASGLAATLLPEPLVIERVWLSRDLVESGGSALRSRLGVPPPPRWSRDPLPRETQTPASSLPCSCMHVVMWFCVCRRTQASLLFLFYKLQAAGSAGPGSPDVGVGAPSWGQDLLGRTLRF